MRELLATYTGGETPETVRIIEIVVESDDTYRVIYIAEDGSLQKAAPGQFTVLEVS